MRYTKEEIEYLKDNVQSKTNKELANGLSRTEYSIAYKLNDLKLKRDMPNRWTEEEDGKLKEMCVKYTSTKIAEEIGRSRSSVKNRIHKLGLKVPACIKENTYFKKGHNPQNKGKNMPQELRDKIKHTWFKKGHKPAQYMPVGTKRIAKGGYTEIKKLDPNIWVPYSHYVWEKNGLEVGKGNVITFKDGDITNFDITNLERITRKELVRRNHNPAKIAKTRKKGVAEGKYTPTHKFVSSLMAQGDKELRNELEQNHKELLDIEAERIRLQGMIKYGNIKQT